MRSVYYSEKTSDDAFKKDYIQAVGYLNYVEPDFVAFIKKSGNVKVQNKLKIFFKFDATVNLVYKINYTVKETIGVSTGFYRGRLDTINNTLNVSPEYASKEQKMKLDETQTAPSKRKLILIPNGKSFRVIEDRHSYSDALPSNKKYKPLKGGAEKELIAQVPEIAQHGGWDDFIENAYASLREALENLTVENWDKYDFDAEKTAKQDFKADHPSRAKAGPSYEINNMAQDSVYLKKLDNVEVYYYWERTATVNYKGKEYVYSDCDDNGHVAAKSVPKSKKALEAEDKFIKKTKRLTAAIIILMLASFLIGCGYVAVAFLVGKIPNTVDKWIEIVLSKYVSFAAAVLGIISIVYSIPYLTILKKIKQNSSALSVTAKTKSDWFKVLGVRWGRKKFACWFFLALAYAFFVFLAALYLIAHIL